jgi:RND family efflux transporter MFP subunit
MEWTTMNMSTAMEKILNLKPGCLVGLIVTMTGMLCWAGCKEKSKAVSPPPAAVEVITVAQADVPVYHEWIGSLDGLVNARINAQVTGYLLTQNYREGDSVKKGDLLFEIDPRPFQATLDLAKGVLAEAEARLGKAELDVKRYTPLVSDKAISREEYDDAIQADLEAKAAVVSYQAQVEQAQINLDFTRIESPVDGVPSIARAQIGDLVGPASGELATVSKIDPIKAYFDVNEQAYINFTKMYPNDDERRAQLHRLEIQLILADGSTYPLVGHIFASDREIGQTTGALRLEGLFPNPQSVLRPGQFARVRVKFAIRHDALLVPQRAVVELQGAYQVAVLNADKTIHIQPVSVGERLGTSWIIEDGIHAGQRVVVEGVQKIKEGSLVNPTDYVAGTSARTGDGSTQK